MQSASGGRIYVSLRWLLRRSVGIYFRRIEIVGAELVPDRGPVVFCCNHPNSLLDPVLIACCCDRPVRFAASDALFESRFLQPFLRAMQAVAIQRRQEHASGALANEPAFRTMYDTLAAGDAVGIFPEGMSHTSSRMAQLKTGVARIALGAAERHPGLAVRLLPCGLSYLTPNRFRSSVLIQFGLPLTVDREWLEAHRLDSRRTVLALTAEIDRRLRALTIDADDPETVRVLDGIRRLYQPRRIRLSQRVELARRFNRYYPRFAALPEVRALLDRVRNYLDRVARLGLRDRDVRGAGGSRATAGRALRYAALVLLWLPLAVLGAPLYLPVGLLLGWSGERFAPRQDVVATTKFILGLLALALAFISIPTALAVVFGVWPALAASLALPLSGYATLKVLERLASLTRLVRTSVRSPGFRTELASLRRERRLLQAEVNDAVERFRPEDPPPLFARRPAADDQDAESN